MTNRLSLSHQNIKKVKDVNERILTKIDVAGIEATV